MSYHIETPTDCAADGGETVSYQAPKSPEYIVVEDDSDEDNYLPRSPLREEDMLVTRLRRASIDGNQRTSPSPVLGKRGRSESPAFAIQDALFEEISSVNEQLFKTPCITLGPSPDTFYLLVACHPKWRLTLVFPPEYPSVAPKCIESSSNNGRKVKLAAEDILSRISTGTQCLERLCRQLVEVLQISNVPWKNKMQGLAGRGNPAPSGNLSIHQSWIPQPEELHSYMGELRKNKSDYPPRIPEFKTKDGFAQAFVSEEYAKRQFREKAEVMEGNERLEYLVLYCVSILKKHADVLCRETRYWKLY